MVVTSDTVVPVVQLLRYLWHRACSLRQVGACHLSERLYRAVTGWPRNRDSPQTSANEHSGLPQVLPNVLPCRTWATCYSAVTSCVSVSQKSVRDCHVSFVLASCWFTSVHGLLHRVQQSEFARSVCFWLYVGCTSVNVTSELNWSANAKGIFCAQMYSWHSRGFSDGVNQTTDANPTCSLMTFKDGCAWHIWRVSDSGSTMSRWTNIAGYYAREGAVHPCSRLINLSPFLPSHALCGGVSWGLTTGWARAAKAPFLGDDGARSLMTHAWRHHDDLVRCLSAMSGFSQPGWSLSVSCPASFWASRRATEILPRNSVADGFGCNGDLWICQIWVRNEFFKQDYLSWFHEILLQRCILRTTFRNWVSKNSRYINPWNSV